MTVWTKAFATACVFLTRIPMPTLLTITPQDQGRSLLCFPLVGLCLGCLLAIIAVGCSQLFSDGVAAALVLAAWAAVTGGLHLDGLADSADGWLGGFGDPQRTLDIMHDSRCGTGAVVAVSCLLIVKFAALTLVIDNHMWPLLIAAPIIGRCAGPLLFIRGKLFHTPYVNPTGIASHFLEYCPRQARIVSYGAALVAALLCGSLLAAAVVLTSCGAMLYLLRRLMLRRLGGATGDTAGAATEILETVVLVAGGAILS